MKQKELKKHTCCFFGHRKIDMDDDLIHNLKKIIEFLITNEKADTFLFGSRSQFINLCLDIVTEYKKKYPHIKRIYVRAEFPYIDESYTAYLMKSYDNTYYPKRILNSGKAAYVERNYEMIDNSSYCVIYYDEKYKPPKTKQKNMEDYQPKSGTKLAFNYSRKKDIKIINLLEIKP